jgi:GxxExxY protein
MGAVPRQIFSAQLLPRSGRSSGVNDDAKTDTYEPSAQVDAVCHRVIGAALEVHRMLGPGFLESVYEEALCIELSLRGIPFARQVPIAVAYKGNAIGEARIDILVNQCLVVELKAVESIAPIHVAQVISYLKSTKLPLGLLLTFNVTALRHGIKRVIQSR